MHGEFLDVLLCILKSAGVTVCTTNNALGVGLVERVSRQHSL